MLYRVVKLASIGGFFFIGCQDAKEAEVKISSLEKQEITFSAHIAPILFKNCTPCHRPGMAGPFSLISYNDVIRKLKTVRLVLAENYMPPWPADTSYSRFKGEKTLTKQELDLFLYWIDNGVKPGNLNDIKMSQDTNNHSLLGKPDLVINFMDTIKIKGNSKDHFYTVKVPFEISKNTTIKTIEFIPGNKSLVHHVNGHLINYVDNKRQDIYKGKAYVNSEKENSLEIYKELDLANDDGSYPTLSVSAFNYLPGVEPVVYPYGIGKNSLTKKNAFLLKSMHYGPSPVDTFDFSTINIFYSDDKPKRILKELHLGSLGISPIFPDFIIYANSISSFQTSYITNEDISVLTINPHMHLLGKTFEAYAITRDNVKIPLIRINKWDFRWQYFYTFKKMLKIPSGSKIIVKATFDNTVNNINNPFLPPKTIYPTGEEMRTTDEMFQFFIDYLPYVVGDENITL
jgi:hypothetical protein